MKCYAYCVVESMPNRDLSSVARGLNNRELQTVSIGQLTAVISDFDGDSVPITRANVLGHERAIRSLHDETQTPIPFRFGTLTSRDQLQNFLRSRERALREKLQVVRACVEMSVKIIWQPGPRLEHHTGYSSSGSHLAPGVGAAFLTAKREEILGTQKENEDAREIGVWLSARIAPVVRQQQVSLRPHEKLVLSAAHLVEYAVLQEYRQVLTELRADRPQLHFLASGPWPPYTFANIDLEFKSQFGVS